MGDMSCPCPGAPSPQPVLESGGRQLFRSIFAFIILMWSLMIQPAVISFPSSASTTSGFVYAVDMWIGCMKAKVYSVTKWCEFAGRRVV